MNYAGKEIHRSFRSPREAIAFAVNKRKGPAPRRQRWDDTHGSYTPSEAGEAILCLLTEAGAPPDSDDRAAVVRWACKKGDRTPAVARVERRMRALMGEAGCLEGDILTLATERHAFEDAIGNAHEHLVEMVAGVSRSET